MCFDGRICDILQLIIRTKIAKIRLEENRIKSKMTELTLGSQHGCLNGGQNFQLRANRWDSLTNLQQILVILRKQLHCKFASFSRKNTYDL